MQETNIAIEVLIFMLKTFIMPIIVTLSTMYIANKIERNKKIKENFYYDFYDLYLKSHNGSAYNFTDLNPEYQRKFIDILNKNDKYVNGLLSQLFYEFRVRTGNENMYNEKIINGIFNEITDIVFSKVKTNMVIKKAEAKKINKRLMEREQVDGIYYIKNIDDDGFINTH